MQGRLGKLFKGSDDALKGTDDALQGSEDSWVMDVLSNLGLLGDVIAYLLSNSMAFIASLLWSILIIQIIYKVFWKRKKRNEKTKKKEEKKKSVWKEIGK